MSASLVGSEMCIRDSAYSVRNEPLAPSSKKTAWLGRASRGSGGSRKAQDASGKFQMYPESPTGLRGALELWRSGAQESFRELRG
eukprot:1378531-Alexandrium_andersonii.AAC.1